MKRLLLVFSISLLAICAIAKSVTPAASLPTYYQQIDGKAGKTLFDAVQTVTKVGYSSLGYDGLWGAYPYTDVHENGYVWDMYSDCTWKSINSNHCGSYSNECDCYNREHSIPKSWYGGTTSGPGCDIFHLVPTDGKVNGMRSNYPFGEVSSATYNKQGNKLGSSKSITIMNGNTIAGNEGATISCSASKVFEPRDEYKGDFARGYMGALLRWAGEKNFTDGEGSQTFTSTFTTGSFGLTKYGVALLMKWHRQDPVSKKEIDRNNGIQQTQGNRNPFIDYPYLAEYIWGEKAGETLDLSKLITAYDSRFVLGESNGSLEGGSTVDPVEKCTITWLVNGEVYTTGNPTTSVNKGGLVSVLPSAPKSCDEISTQFVGWSEDVIEGTQDNVPADLFSTADDAPEITQNTTFHAVFANLTEEEGPVADSPCLAMDLNDQEGWTLSGLIKDSKHWRVVSNAYIESPQLELANITSIVVKLRTYGGSTYKTLAFSMNGTKVGEINATTNSLKDYTWTPTSTLSGSGKLRFSSSTCTEQNGPALSAITINLNTGTPSVVYVYSRYITSCNNTGTDVEDVVVAPFTSKILRNGQLLIEYNGVYYNTLGQPVNF